MSPARPAAVSVLQFAEDLTDRHAAHAVRSRLDRKHALSLELTDTGFDLSVLSELRARLAGADGTHVPAATRDLDSLEFVIETLRAPLNRIAEVAGDWRPTVAAPEWFDRDSARPEDSRSHPGGADGMALLEAARSTASCAATPEGHPARPDPLTHPA